MTVETRTITLSAEQMQFVKELVAEYLHNSEVSACRFIEQDEKQTAALYQSDADFAAAILASIRSAGA